MLVAYSHCTDRLAHLPAAILVSFPAQDYATLKLNHLHLPSRTMSFAGALEVLRPTLPY